MINTNKNRFPNALIKSARDNVRVFHPPPPNATEG